MKWHRFHPRSLDILQNYSRERFIKDIGAGVNVGVVALPLAMAFAIASGLTPQVGLWTAIVGGLMIALLGGSPVQIAGPAGAFIVLVYSIVQSFGVSGLLFCTAGSGLLLVLMGCFKIGSWVRLVPVPIITGFTNGIAVLIMISQIKDLLGLQMGSMPAHFFPQVQILSSHLPHYNPYALALGGLCVMGLSVWQRLLRKASPLLGQRIPGANGAIAAASRVPAPIVAMLSLSLLAYWLHWPVETSGARFGAITQSLPHLNFPSLLTAQWVDLIQPTVALALLGAIVSLMCARVADQISQAQPHDPNQELIAQGIVNFTLPFLSGMPVTGAIARTVTNIKSGASSPIAGIVHSLTLLLIVLLAGSLTAYIPLSVLAGILLFVAWNMGEWREFKRMRHFSWHYQAILLITFVLTVVVDLTVAIEVGLALACFFFVKRMSGLFKIESDAQTPDNYSLNGVLFFASIGALDDLQKRVMAAPLHTHITLDARHLVALDTSGLDALEQLHDNLHAKQGRLRILHLQAQPLSLIERAGFSAWLG